MQTALYIVLALLVIGAVAMQVWVARTSKLAGDRSGLVLSIRVFNIVLLVAVVLLVVYALLRR